MLPCYDFNCYSNILEPNDAHFALPIFQPFESFNIIVIFKQFLKFIFVYILVQITDVQHIRRRTECLGVDMVDFLESVQVGVVEYFVELVARLGTDRPCVRYLHIDDCVPERQIVERVFSSLRSVSVGLFY